MTNKTAFALALCLALSAPAAADVTVRSKMKSGGFRGMGAFEGTQTRSVKGEKSRESSDITYKGRLMRMAAPPKDAIRVTRVDLDKVWEILPSKKTYSERSISAQLKEMEKAGRPDGGKPGKPADEEKPTHRIKKSTFDVKKTGQKKTVNGFPTEENQVRLAVEVEEIATKNVSTFRFEADIWTTPFTADLKKAMDEETRFAQAYMNKLGIKLSPKDRELYNPMTVAMMLGVGQANAEETVAQMKKKMETITGYPIVTDARWLVEEDPRVAAARKEAAAAEPEEDSGVDLSGGAKGIAGGLIGGFAKKKVRESQAKKAEERAAQPMFSTYNEVLAVETAAIPAENFDVPAGFKKTGQ